MIPQYSAWNLRNGPDAMLGDPSVFDTSGYSPSNPYATGSQVVPQDSMTLSFPSSSGVSNGVTDVGALPLGGYQPVIFDSSALASYNTPTDANGNNFVSTNPASYPGVNKNATLTAPTSGRSKWLLAVIIGSAALAIFGIAKMRAA